MTRLSREETTARLGEAISELPSLPGAVSRLQQVLNDPGSGAVEAAECLAADPGLTTRLLALANSAFYGFSGKVATIPQAVALLGFHSLWELAFTSGFVGVFRQAARGPVDPMRFWRHSLRAAMATRRLGRHVQDGGLGEAYVAALLHDIGMVTLGLACPQEYGAVQAMVPGGPERIRTELELLGLHHGEAGALLCESWKLPDSIRAVVRHVHDPGSDPPHSSLLQIVALAEVLAGDGEEEAVPMPEAGSLPAQALARLPSGEDWSSLLTEVQADAQGVEDLLVTFGWAGPVAAPRPPALPRERAR